MKDYLGVSIIIYGVLVFWIPSNWLPFSDPRLVANCVILGIYFIVGCWWLSNNSNADFLYWLFAAGITAVVTFGYAR